MYLKDTFIDSDDKRIYGVSGKKPLGSDPIKELQNCDKARCSMFVVLYEREKLSSKKI